MTIGSPSGSGATQNDIANGADRSLGRWKTLYDGALTSAEETVLTVGGSGAVPAFGRGGMEMRSTSSGDNGFCVSGGYNINGQQTFDGRSVLIKCQYVSNIDQPNLSDKHTIGQADTTASPGEFGGAACFRLGLGDVIVEDDAGTSITNSINYPNTTEFNEFVVLIDYNGYYLNNEETGFYINKDPRRGDDPTAKISAVPKGSSQSYFGAFYGSTGAGDRFITDFMEVSLR